MPLAAGGDGRAPHPAGARPRAGHGAAAAAPGGPVRHRGAVDGADRRRVAGGRELAAGRPARRDPAAEAEVAALQDVVTEVRRFRSEQGLRARAAGRRAARPGWRRRASPRTSRWSGR